MRDLDLDAIGAALAAFGVERATTTRSRWRSSTTATRRRMSATGVFRFDYLAERVRRPRRGLLALAFRARGRSRRA